MAITVQPITPDFAAEVGDVDLGRPLSADDVAAIKAAFTKYAVLVFPDQTFSDESHLDFARHFGPLETSVFAMRKDHKMRLAPQMADVGNLDAEDRILADERPHPALPARQPAVAHQLLVQAPAGLLLDPAWPLDPADRRPDRVRRPARRLRCAARGDEAASSQAWSPSIR